MSIDNFKIAISRRKGLAKGNYFVVEMGIPNIIKRNFNIEDLSILCRSTSLPGRQITTIDAQAHKQAIKIPHSFVQEDITLTFILTQDFYIKKIFDVWLSTVFDFNRYRAKYLNTFVEDISIIPVQISLINKTIKGKKQSVPKTIASYKTTLFNAYPFSVQAIPLSSDSGNSLLEVSVSFTYENFVGEEFNIKQKEIVDKLTQSIGIQDILTSIF